MLCEFNEIIEEINNNCENDLHVIKDTCRVICLSSIVKAMDYCYFKMLNTGLMEQMKEVIKYCYYKKNESTGGH